MLASAWSAFAAALPAMGQTTASWLSAINGTWNQRRRLVDQSEFPQQRHAASTTYDAFINATGASYNVTLNSNITVNSLTLTPPARR